MFVWIVLGVVSLVVLVGAYFASQRWHWAHVLVLVAFYGASVGYLVLSARSLDKRTGYQKREADALKNLDLQNASIDALASGTDNPSVLGRLASSGAMISEDAEQTGGILEQRHQLRMLNRDRGRVWINATPMSEIDQETGAVTIGVPVMRPQAAEGEEPTEAQETPAEPGPLGLSVDSVVYLFEQGPAMGGGEAAERGYLGEFRVVEQVSPREVRLEPLGQFELDPVGAQRLFDSRGPWIVYESMPADDRDLFAGLNEEQLRALLPAESVDDYLRDGGEVTPDDPEYNRQGLDADGIPITGEDDGQEAVSYRYRRLKRDYGYLFKEFSRERAELFAKAQAVRSDSEKLAVALEGAEKIREFRQDEIAKLESDLASLKRDKRAIEKHVEALESQIAKAERLLEETLRANADLAARAEASAGDLQPIASGAIDPDAL